MTPLTRYQRVLGVLGTLLMLSLMSVIYAIGEGTRHIMNTFRVDHLALPFTRVLVSAGRFVGNYWYVPALLIIYIYVYWVSRNSSRVLWWNAVLSVALPIIILACVHVRTEQIMVIEEAMRKR